MAPIDCPERRFTVKVASWIILLSSIYETSITEAKSLITRPASLEEPNGSAQVASVKVFFFVALAAKAIAVIRLAVIVVCI